MTGFCEHCGAAKVPGTRFCRGCGANLEEQTEALVAATDEPTQAAPAAALDTHDDQRTQALPGDDDPTEIVDRTVAPEHRPSEALPGDDTTTHIGRPVPGARSPFYTPPIPEFRPTPAWLAGADEPALYDPATDDSPVTDPDATSTYPVAQSVPQPPGATAGPYDAMGQAPAGPTRRSGASGSPSPAVLTAIVVAVLVIAGGATAGVLLLTGKDDRPAKAKVTKRPATTKGDGDTSAAAAAAAAKADDQNSGGNDADAEPDTDSAAEDTAPDEAPSDDTAASDDGPTGVALEPHSGQGYDISLPAGWSVSLDDAKQPTPAGVTRRRYELTDGELRVVVDHLTGFDVSAEANRDTIAAGGPEAYSGYRLVGLSEVDLAQATGYEWRFSHVEGGRRVRKVNVMLDLDGDSFAVLAISKGDAADHEQLASLAERIAASVSAR